MAYPTCLISSDLSTIRVFSDGGLSIWDAPAISDEEAERPGPWLIRVREAARWLQAQPAVRRRLAAVCIDVDQMVCSWLRAPAASANALSAAWRDISQEWGAAAQGWTVQSLRSVHEQSKPRRKLPFVRSSNASVDDEQGVRGPVVAAPDALVRLWLDALDRQGVRSDTVFSLWHAIASVWTTSDGFENAQLQATIATTADHRLVWCWNRGRQLVCAGSTALSRSPDSDSAEDEDSIDLEQAVQRLTMDWLSWTAHLGESPAAVSSVGAYADELASLWRARWPQMHCDSQFDADVIATTLTRLGADRALTTGLSDDPARCLIHATSRPNRAMRSRYYAAAIILALLAVAIGGIGWRIRQSAAAHRADADVLRSQTSALVEALGDPALAGPNPRRALESRIVEEMSKPRIQLPREPFPVFEELKRVAETIARFPDVDLTQITIDDGNAGSMQLNVPSRQVAVELQVALQQGGALSWAPTRSTPGADQRLQLTGSLPR